MPSSQPSPPPKKTTIYNIQGKVEEEELRRFLKVELLRKVGRKPREHGVQNLRKVGQMP